MRLHLFILLICLAFFMTGYKYLLMADIFIHSILNYIVYLCVFLFPVFFIFLCVVFLVDLFKKSLHEYYNVILLVFIAFFVGFFKIAHLLYFARCEYILLSTVFLFLFFSFKKKNIRYVGISFLIVLSFCMRYLFLL